MKFSFNECASASGEIFQGLLEITPQTFSDERGAVYESFNESEFEIELKKRSIAFEKFVQDTNSFSKKNVLRGMHFQKKHSQAKLVQCIFGKVLDVVLDLRSGSETFARAFTIVLDGEKRNQLYIPKGFAHGFFVLSDEALCSYKCSDFYDANDEGGIIWNDEIIFGEWKEFVDEKKLVISAKDKLLENFNRGKKYFSLTGTWIGE